MHEHGWVSVLRKQNKFQACSLARLIGMPLSLVAKWFYSPALLVFGRHTVADNGTTSISVVLTFSMFITLFLIILFFNFWEREIIQQLTDHQGIMWQKIPLYHSIPLCLEHPNSRHLTSGPFPILLHTLLCTQFESHPNSFIEKYEAANPSEALATPIHHPCCINLRLAAIKLSSSSDQ